MRDRYDRTGADDAAHGYADGGLRAPSVRRIGVGRLEKTPALRAASIFKACDELFRRLGAGASGTTALDLLLDPEVVMSLGPVELDRASAH